MRMNLLSLLFLFPVFTPAVELSHDSTDTATVIDSTIMNDSLTSDSIPDTTIHNPAGDSTTTRNKISDSSQSVSKTLSNPLSRADSVHIYKNYFGYGAAVNIGSLPIVNLWKGSLPDSLSSFNLLPNSFLSLSDSAAATIQSSDSLTLVYSIKEQPNVYNMTFPLSLTFVHTGKNGFFNTDLSFSFLSKQFKASVFPRYDTTNAVNLKESLLLYSLNLGFNYGFAIPKEYFSIEGVNNSYFVLGVGISPLVSIHKAHSLRLHGHDSRMLTVKKTIDSALSDETSYGGSLSFRVGMTTTKLIPHGAIQAGVFYTCTRYDYFRDNGKVLQKKDFFDAGSDGRLSFISNRLELQFCFLHGLKPHKQ